MQNLRMNYAGVEWQTLKEWLLQLRASKVQRIIQPGTDQREVENIRGGLQLIELLLTQETRAANSREE